jgi:long-chain acyl-CoA synthetase
MPAELPPSVVGRTAARLARQVDVALAGIDLSSAQYRMLFQLDEGAESSTLIARKLEVSAPSVTAVVDGLVQRGFVVRNHSDLDRRRVSLELTPEGRRMLLLADAAVHTRLLEVADRDAGQVELLETWTITLDSYRARRQAHDEQAEVARA